MLEGHPFVVGFPILQVSAASEEPDMIPIFSIEAAKSYRYYGSPFSEMTNWMPHIIRNILRSPFGRSVPRAKHELCLSRPSGRKPIHKLYSRKVSAILSVSNRSIKDQFLCAPGYKRFGKQTTRDEKML